MLNYSHIRMKNYAVLMLNQVRMYEKFSERNSWKHSAISCSEVFFMKTQYSFKLLMAFVNCIICFFCHLLGRKRGIQNLCDGDKRKSCL